MSKKKSKSKPKALKGASPKQQREAAKGPAPQMDISKLPKETQEKLKKIKSKIESFQKKIVDKFEKYIVGVALLPPPKPKEGEKPDMDSIHTLILVDDSDSKKMPKHELKNRLTGIIAEMAKEIDKNIKPQTVILSELWQSAFDGKYDLLKTISLSAPVYDTGMLSAIRISEIHKTMVLKKFEKYIVSYVLAGSLTQGRATATSDIDVWIVIDDTDVKKMTRAELKDKLRAIIIGMGIEAGEMTGIKNKLNIQVYILTDFWDSLKEANPVIFTLLRDGVPFYDRGVFMPWKQLLRMGKIKPSAEAIDMFMNSGEQMLKRVEHKLREMGMEDVYYALLTPSQAAIMMMGMAPPSPRETSEILRDVFVKKKKMLEDKFVKILEKTIQMRKDLEHGTKKSVTGKEIDELLTDAKEYLKRIQKLFTQIEKRKDEEGVVHIYDSIITVLRDVLRLEGIEKVTDKEIVKEFEDKLISTGKVPAKFLRTLNELMKAKADYDSGKLTKQEVGQVKKDAGIFIRFIVEYMQRKRGRELDRAKIRVKHGNKFGEVLLLEDTAFIIHDLDNEAKKMSKAKINPDGSLGTTSKATMEELEEHLAKFQIPPKVFIKHKLFEELKDLFGKDVEILVNY